MLLHYAFVVLTLARLQGNLMVLDQNWIENIAYLSIIKYSKSFTCKATCVAIVTIVMILTKNMEPDYSGLGHSRSLQVWQLQLLLIHWIVSGEWADIIPTLSHIKP